ncbi:MAG: GNAT family N-acetyltransferase [Actinomycetota bacterium]
MGSGRAWDLVRAATERSGVRVAPLVELRDADRIRDVVDVVWGDQAPSREIVRAMQHAGSVLYGAEAGGALVGFVWGFVGFAEGLHLHSHMLAVVPEWQARGVGFALKLAQRAGSLDHGIAEVRWTYDPLVALNARFNLVKLGAEGARFLRDFYGQMTDRLNRDDRSDRFEVRWGLNSERVIDALEGRAGRAAVEGPRLVGRSARAGGARPERSGGEPVPGARVAIPEDYHRLKAGDADLARRWRDECAEVFAECFDAGLVATSVTGDTEYVFEMPPT